MRFMSSVILMACLAVSCKESTEPSPPEPDTQTPASDASSPGNPTPDAAAEPVGMVDLSQLGEPCSERETCPQGASCYYYPGVAEPRCMSGDPCRALTCPASYKCGATLGDTSGVRCFRQ